MSIVQRRVLPTQPQAWECRFGGAGRLLEGCPYGDGALAEAGGGKYADVEFWQPLKQLGRSPPSAQESVHRMW